jgi:hypothetical protein
MPRIVRMRAERDEATVRCVSCTFATIADQEMQTLSARERERERERENDSASTSITPSF